MFVNSYVYLGFSGIIFLVFFPFLVIKDKLDMSIGSCFSIIPPFGFLFRALGGVPVKRDRQEKLVATMVELFSKRENLMLAVPVEGTRGYTDYWKSGFYHIAKGANVPILPTFLDYGSKRGGFGIPIQTTDNLSLDMEKIRNFYAPFKGKFPLKSGPIKLQEEDQI